MRARHQRIFLSWIAAASLFSSGCAFGDGQPWGRIDPSVSVARDLPDSRVDDQGRWITAADYAIEIEAREVAIVGVTLRLSSAVASAAVFDPGAPPPGYSLCHNGHCHHDSGALVDYEDIAAELAASDTSGGLALELLPTSPWHPVTLEATEIPLAPCPGRCFVPIGSLRTVEVVVGALRVTGRAFDRRTGDARRLSDEGVPLETTIALEETLRGEASALFDRGEPVGAAVAATLTLPVELFDGADWAASDSAIAEAVRDRFTSHASLSIHVHPTD